MSVEIWHSELVLYGFIILNLVAVSAALVWCWRHGLLGGPDDLSLGSLPGGNLTRKENVHD